MRILPQTSSLLFQSRNLSSFGLIFLVRAGGIRAIYTGENKTRPMQDAPYIRRELYHLYVRELLASYF